MNRTLIYCFILFLSINLVSCKKKSEKLIIGNWDLIEHTRSDTSLIDFYESIEVHDTCTKDSIDYPSIIQVENEISENQQWKFNEDGTCDISIEYHEQEFEGLSRNYECGEEAPDPWYYSIDTSFAFNSDWTIHHDVNELEIGDGIIRYEIMSLDNDQMELKVLESNQEIYMTFEKFQ
jgi:hypothetical protein